MRIGQIVAIEDKNIPHVQTGIILRREKEEQEEEDEERSLGGTRWGLPSSSSSSPSFLGTASASDETSVIDRAHGRRASGETTVTTRDRVWGIRCLVVRRVQKFQLHVAIIERRVVSPTWRVSFEVFEFRREGARFRPRASSWRFVSFRESEPRSRGCETDAPPRASVSRLRFPPGRLSDDDPSYAARARDEPRALARRCVS